MRQFVRFLVRTIPRPILIRFSYLFSAIFSFLYKGNKYECPICGGTFKKMMPYGNQGDLNRLCPKCLSLERHRYMWLFLQSETDFFKAPKKVLHIAPEQPFFKRFRKLENLDYTTGDLFSPLADVKMDIQDIPFEDNTFDMVICNHVLEHVDDDFKAMKEFLRVLKPGGNAILQVPINPKLKETYEDKTITDPKEREKHFGQYDHVRFHGLDFPDRLKKAGFDVKSVNMLDIIGEEKTERYRIFREGEEFLYWNTKKSNS